MRRVGPAHIEESAVLRILLPGGEDAVAIARVDWRFGACKKAGTDPRACSTQCHRCGQTASVCNATGSKHGNRRDLVNDRRHQRHRGHGAFNMATRLPALSDGCVRTIGGRYPRLFALPTV